MVVSDVNRSQSVVPKVFGDNFCFVFLNTLDVLRQIMLSSDRKFVTPYSEKKNGIDVSRARQ